MNRYRSGPAIGGPSKATASTTCQKCLKKDTFCSVHLETQQADHLLRHYSYECKSIVQERPYVSRPSRSQQLLNPKLVPKLTSDIPQDLLRKKGIADEQLAKLEQGRGRKHERQSEDSDIPGPSKRMRSASSNSVSTISTSLSRSPSPQPKRKTLSSKPRSISRSRSPPRRNSFRQSRRSSPSHSTSPQPRMTESERKRRRSSGSSSDSYTSDGAKNSMNDSRERASSRSTRRKFNQVSPASRGRRTESRSPDRGRRPLSNDRKKFDFDRVQERNTLENGIPPPRPDLRQENKVPPRQKSLSPFSKRLALTQAMNMGK